MESREVIEVWRAEFLSLDLQHGDEIIDGYIWDGFLEAKRAQPVVELPSGIGMTISYREGLSDAKDALTAAGIQFKVRG